MSILEESEVDAGRCGKLLAVTKFQRHTNSLKHFVAHECICMDTLYKSTLSLREILFLRPDGRLLDRVHSIGERGSEFST